MVDHHVENDAQRMRASVPLVGVGGVYQVDQILFGAEVRVDAEIAVDVVAVVRAGIVLEDRRQPDGRAAEAGDVVEVPGDAAELAAVEIVGYGHSGRPSRARGAGPRLIVMEAIHQQEVDELLTPLPVALKIDPVRRGSEIELSDRGRGGHDVVSSCESLASQPATANVGARPNPDEDGTTRHAAARSLMRDPIVMEDTLPR